MTIEEVKDYINSSPEYDFLRDYPRKIAFLTLGGSYAYGTNTEDSDIDLRGVFLSNKREILLSKDLLTTDTLKDTDTVMYPLRKYVDLCAKGNFTTLEFLYNRVECYLYISDIGIELIKNRDMFLSKRMCRSFDGYVKSFIHKILFTYYPADVLSEDVLQERKNKTCKAMAHVVRTLINGIDMMQNGEISPLSYKVLNELREIRRGSYSENTHCCEDVEEDLMVFKPNKQLLDKIAILRRDFINACEKAALPDKPNFNRINDFLMTTNERIVRGMV